MSRNGEAGRGADAAELLFLLFDAARTRKIKCREMMKMKRLLMGLLCIAMALLVPVFALAAELSGEATVDVKIKYTEEDMQYSTALGSGKAITLQDGTKVTVQPGNDADNGIKVVVILVTEGDADAFSYVSDRMSAYGEKPYAFYILFYKNGQKVTPSAPVTVTVTVPGGYEEAALYTFAGDGSTVQKILDGAQGGAWTFEVSDSSYFAAVLPKEETDPTAAPVSGTDGDGTGGTSGSGRADSAKTGDDTNILFWMVVLAGAVGVLIGGMMRLKRSYEQF